MKNYTKTRKLMLVSVLCFLIYNTAQSGKPVKQIENLITEVYVTGSLNNLITVIADDPLAEGSLAFVDRSHEWIDLPEDLPGLIGSQYLITGADDRNAADFEMSVTLSAPCILYMFLDERIAGDDFIPDTPKPWMTDMGFINTGFDIGIDHSGDGMVVVYASIYEASFKKGEHFFPSLNYGGVLQYTFAAIPAPAKGKGKRNKR